MWKMLSNTMLCQSTAKFSTKLDQHTDIATALAASTQIQQDMVKAYIATSLYPATETIMEATTVRSVMTIIIRGG